jgi:hypothetical protein
MHDGLDKSFWFMWPIFPGWVQKTMRTSLFPRTDLLVRNPIEDEIKEAMRLEEIAAIKRELEEVNRQVL